MSRAQEKRPGAGPSRLCAQPHRCPLLLRRLHQVRTILRRYTRQAGADTKGSIDAAQVIVKLPATEKNLIPQRLVHRSEFLVHSSSDVLIDLHNHTAPQSWDSTLTPDILIMAAKEAGLQGVCLTEHDQFWADADVRDLAKRHDFLVLPGCEITTEDGHLLVFGLNRYVFGMHRAPLLKEQADAGRGVIVAAHPYRRNFREEKEGPWVPPYEEQVLKAAAIPALELAVAVETLNGRGSKPQNRFSGDVCHRRNMNAVGGSDAHDLQDIGACATEFSQAVRDLESLVEALRYGRYCPVDLRSGAEPAACHCRVVR